MMSYKTQATGQPTRAPVILMTGGGSGGHITPILSLARELKRLQPNCHLVYVGLKGDKLQAFDDDFKLFDERYRITAGKLRRYHGQHWLLKLIDLKTLFFNLRDGFKLLVGSRQANRLIKKIQPDIVFSKGGYVVVPVGWAAHRHGIEIITHDSDATPGLANRLIGRWAKLHAVGWPSRHYPYPKDSLRYVGVPVKPGLKPVSAEAQTAAKQKLGIPETAPVLLVGGAGLGSETLNELTLATAKQLMTEQTKLVLIHLSGHRHIDSLKSAYQKQLDQSQLKRLKLMAFSEDFTTLSAAADLVVSRAGATSIAEFAAQAKACIFLPAPWLPGGQQLENAKLLAEGQAAVILDNSVSAAEFARTITELLGDPKQRQQLGQKLNKLAKPDATEQLAKIIIEEAGAA